MVRAIPMRSRWWNVIGRIEPVADDRIWPEGGRGASENLVLGFGFHAASDQERRVRAVLSDHVKEHCHNSGNLAMGSDVQVLSIDRQVRLVICACAILGV